MPVIDTGIDLKSALILTLSVSLVMLASGALSQWYGRAGLLVVAMTGGLADAHSVAASVTSLVEQGRLSVTSAALPILAGVSTNALAKGVVATISGGPRFAKTVVPGLVFVVAAIWLADILSSTDVGTRRLLTSTTKHAVHRDSDLCRECHVEIGGSRVIPPRPPRETTALPFSHQIASRRASMLGTLTVPIRHA